MPAGDRYVVVPAETMFSFLESKGFWRSDKRSRREVVYERAHERDGRYRILIYTSVGVGQTVARRSGGDAIRVAAIIDLGTYVGGIAKLPRVFRTGSVEAVLERTIERAREAYAACSRKILNRSHGR